MFRLQGFVLEFVTGWAWLVFPFTVVPRSNGRNVLQDSKQLFNRDVYHHILSYVFT